MQHDKCRTVYLAGVMKASAPEAKTTSAAAAAQVFMIVTRQEVLEACADSVVRQQ
jgi:hypothetical protein